MQQRDLVQSWKMAGGWLVGGWCPVQYEKRIHKAGQKRNVIVHFVVLFKDENVNEIKVSFLKARTQIY